MSILSGLAKIAKGVLGVATGGVSNIVLDAAGGLIHKKKKGAKNQLYAGRAMGPLATMGHRRAGIPMIGATTAQILRASPVMPGGGVATPAGVMGASSGTPPATYGGRGGIRRAAGRRRKRSSSAAPRRKRRLKFGSAAWRAKYQRRRRRR